MSRTTAILTSLMFLGAFSGYAAADAAATSTSPNRFGGIRVMPGGTIAEGAIVYDGGAVVVRPRGVPDSFDSCPAGSVCLFAQTSWNGAMVQFNSCCAWENLGAYGFNNTAESWRNRMGVDAQLALDSGGGGDRLCLGNNAYAASMPSGWANSASSIRVRDASTYC